jgi:hypothetical protein
MGIVREIFGFLGFLVILVLVCLMIGVVVGFLPAVNFYASRLVPPCRSPRTPQLSEV